VDLLALLVVPALTVASLAANPSFPVAIFDCLLVLIGIHLETEFTILFLLPQQEAVFAEKGRSLVRQHNPDLRAHWRWTHLIEAQID
jgi:hypothetical protein